MADYEVGTGSLISALAPGDRIGLVRGGSPAAMDAGALLATKTDARFYGVERLDLKARYGARADGTSHPLAGLYGALAAAQAVYPNAGLTGANWSAMEIDTAAVLQAEYDLRTGSGGIIGLADNAAARLSQQLWLQDASRVAFHGGRGTRLMTEGTGTTPAIRLSNAWGGELGPAQPVPLRDLGLMAFNSGRSSFGLNAGVAYPGYADSTALAAGSLSGYRTGATAILIDDGGVGGQHSTNFVLERVRWCNFDESIKWGNNTFAATFDCCFAEGNNKGFSWSQTTGLNSGEKIIKRGGSSSNNNYGFYWISNYSGNEQGVSLFIMDESIDYNIVAQGVFKLAPDGVSYNLSRVSIKGSHIENNPAGIGPGTWFTVQGSILLLDNEVFVNGAAPNTGLVTLGDNSTGKAIGNTLKGTGYPLFYSPTSGRKTIEGAGNDYSYGTLPVILATDANGSTIQRPSTGAENCLVNPGVAAFTYTSRSHGHYSVIELNNSTTTFVLPANGPDSFQVNHGVWIINTDATNSITTMVPAGLYCVGLNGTVDNRGGSSTIAGPVIPPKSKAFLAKRDLQGWAYNGPYVSTYAG